MGWLLGCFKCTGKPEGVNSKKKLTGVNNLVSGRSNSAAVAHATSPENLHLVRKSPSAATSKGHIEKEPNDTLSSPLQDQAKPRKSAKYVSKHDEDRVRPHEYDLDGELESFRERLLQDANGAKQLSNEVKILRGCHESPNNTFKVTFDNSEQDSTEQVDYTHQPWLVSSLVTRIQPGGLVIEACSRPSSPLLNLCEGSTRHSRGINASQSNSFDSFADSSALKCAELSLFRVESGVCDTFVDGICESLLTSQNKPERHVPSPPWAFSATEPNKKISSIDERSDDLLLEHLDVASLIEDSALITNWELSSGSSFPGTFESNDQALSQVSNGEKTELLVKSLSSEQTNQKHSESRADVGTLDLDLDRSPTFLEACTENQPGSCKNTVLDEASCSSNGIPSGNERIHDEDKCISKDSENLFRAEFCAAVEESDSDSTPQSCFSSQFRLSKRVWSSAKKNLADKESNMGDYLWHNYIKDAHEVLLPSMRAEMESFQESKNWEDEHHPLLSAISDSSIAPNDNRVGLGDSTDLHANDNVSTLSIRPLEAKLPQDATEDVLKKDEPDLTTNRNASLTSFPVEEEDAEQRKKLKIGHDSLSGGMQVGILVEDDDKVPLLDDPAIENDHQSSLEVSVSKQASDVTMHVIDESSFKHTPVTLSSLPHVGTPPSVTSYRSPASLADERPILGTVAAHWSPITTRKWWDGKGIPNSTNKYQEDQKVSWHAIPFEVRLEQALAKQDTVLSK